ncbi:hypothetical protein SADUNF_Sadunf16G0083300 [Salix dunnii]|uniref:Transcription factor-like protein DPB n=1 Tax=Salix dunnii TaxID=1413687 RepID=A0A835JAJ3_9ROSI|nr:hypothetical protein SADUNF_Sadunf16G0083300 [Salix dunnii]
MVTGGAHLEDGDRHPSSATRGGATAGSWVSGQSVSTSGSVGSPSSRSEHAMATPASDNAFLRLNHLDIHADDAVTQDAAANKKKKRGQRSAGGADKSGRGLRQFSMKGVCIQSFSNMPPFLLPEKPSALVYACLLKDRIPCYARVDFMILLFCFSPVCEKVESKGTTTYNEVMCFLELAYICSALVSSNTEVADELVAEFADPSNSVSTPDQQQYDEKNIRRRVYDALNVLMALDIISKDKKEIQWKGLPRTSLSDIEELKAERLGLRNRIEKKAAYLQELEEQFVGLQNLIQRNEQLYSSGNAPSGGVSLPFILVQSADSVLNNHLPSSFSQRNDFRNLKKAKPFNSHSLIEDLKTQVPSPFRCTRVSSNREIITVTKKENQVILGIVGTVTYASEVILRVCKASLLQWDELELQTRPHATVEVEISEDMQLVHFDFNSTPFELHDDNYVLKAMKFCERPQSNNMAPNPAAGGGEGASMSIMYQPQIRSSPRTNNPVRPPTSPPLPGIIKARVKHEP